MATVPGQWSVRQHQTGAPAEQEKGESEIRGTKQRYVRTDALLSSPRL
jgi:hypothetical protein